MKEQANNFVQQYGSARKINTRHSNSANVSKPDKTKAKQNLTSSGGGGGGKRYSSSNSSSAHRNRRRPNLQVRRTLRVKIKKSKPILGIAIEGGFNVSGQLLPRIVCVHVSI